MMKIKPTKDELKRVLKDTFPVLTGYIFLGIGFGILLQEAGYGAVWAFLMSLTIYGGTMQYVAVSLFAANASMLTVAVTAVMVQIRHLFYGLSMIDKYKILGKEKPYLIFAITDETYSLISQDHPEMSKDQLRRYYIYVCIFDHSYWIIGSVLGVLLGNLITFSTEGIDFVLTALFITIFTDQWLKYKNHIPALVGVVSTAVCRIIFGSDNFLLPSMILITAALFLLKGFMREEDIDD